MAHAGRISLKAILKRVEAGTLVRLLPTYSKNRPGWGFSYLRRPGTEPLHLPHRIKVVCVPLAAVATRVASSYADLSPALSKIAAYDLYDNDVEDFGKNALLGAGSATKTVASVLQRKDTGLSCLSTIAASRPSVAEMVGFGSSIPRCLSVRQ
jgi:hypothetical protein